MIYTVWLWPNMPSGQCIVEEGQMPRSFAPMDGWVIEADNEEDAKAEARYRAAGAESRVRR